MASKTESETSVSNGRLHILQTDTASTICSDVFYEQH